MLINQDLDESETLFLSEVFSGCVRFSSIIDVVVGGFYNQDGASFLQADRNILNGQLNHMIILTHFYKILYI